MSVSQQRRKSALLVAALAAGSIVATVALAASTPVPVKTTRHNEVGPTAGSGWLVWSKSREKRTSPFDLWAQHAPARAFRLNPKDTQAYGGGIDGTKLLYQLIRGQFATESDLRLFDLESRRRQALPSGINTTNWECCGTISGDWILFSRGRAYSPGRQLVMLRNLVTGEQRVLDSLRNRNGLVSAGQINGNYAVWHKCNPYPQCVVYRYELTTATATALPTVPAKVVYSPSVNPYGTVYYLQSTRGCGKSVQLMKQRLVGLPEVLASLPPGRDGDVTYADTVPPDPPSETATTHVYFDRVVCRKQAWDIYRADDLERLPPPNP
ncbi:MAG: hypothetical protein AABM30_10670 [Actinomycetota bacterium]